MIKFLLQASSAMLFTLASLTTVIAQDCITFEFPNETGEATFLSDADMCGTNVTWEEPAIIDTCDEETEVTIVTNFEQGQYFDVGYYELVYQAFDENEVLLGQSEFYLDVFDDTAPVPQGENITQDDPIDFPQYYDGPDVFLTGEFNVDDLPNYTALDNCAGEVDGVVEYIELDDNTTQVTYIFSDGTQASELDVLVYSNVLNCVVFDFPSGEETFNSDADMCGTNVQWVEPTVTNNCGDGEVTIVTNFDQGQYFEVGYYQLVYQAFDEDGILLGQSELYLDVFDNLVPVPQGEDITQENPIDFPQYFDGPDVNLEGDYDVALLPNYIALDNCAGEVVGVPEVVVLDADTRVVTYIFSDGTQSSELDILVYSNVVIDSVGESI
ncbi:MAG: HYR domain-containing protein [Flavobacteriales bacterium]